MFEFQLIVNMNCYDCGFPQTGFETALYFSLPFPSELEVDAVTVPSMLGESLSQFVP